MNRGDGREDIFVDNKDRKCFVETLGESCDKTALSNVLGQEAPNTAQAELGL
jgi:hypothetical protein